MSNTARGQKAELRPCKICKSTLLKLEWNQSAGNVKLVCTKCKHTHWPVPEFGGSVLKAWNAAQRDGGKP